MNIEYRNIVSVKELLGMLKTISDNIEYLSENSEKYVDLTLDVLKDSKVKELSKKLKDFQDKNYVQTAYSFSENNIKDAEIWVNEHEREFHKNSEIGCIGERYTYCITPTSIGCFKSIKCSCGISHDLEGDF